MKKENRKTGRVMRMDEWKDEKKVEAERLNRHGNEDERMDKLMINSGVR